MLKLLSLFAMNMQFELLNPDIDFENLVQFLESVSSDFTPPLIDRTRIDVFASRILPPYGFSYGLKQFKKIAAVGGIELHDTELGASAFRVLVVANEFRGSTVAVRLAKHIMREFERNGGKEIWGKTWHTNTRSIRLMTHVGFEFQYELKNARGEGINEVHYLWKNRNN